MSRTPNTTASIRIRLESLRQARIAAAIVGEPVSTFVSTASDQRAGVVARQVPRKRKGGWGQLKFGKCANDK